MRLIKAEVRAEKKIVVDCCKPLSLSESKLLNIRDLSLDDLQDVAKVHLSAFPESALTQLGRETVRRYYEWQINNSRNARTFGAFIKNEMIGFCFAGVFRNATSGFLYRNRFYLAWRVLSRLWLIGKPMFRSRIVSAVKILRRRLKRKQIFRKKTSETSIGFPAHAPSFGILSIAVAEDWQGAGVADALMREAETAARRGGFSQMNLSVHTDNSRAIRFYEKQGWTKFLENGDWHGQMKKSLTR